MRLGLTHIIQPLINGPLTIFKNRKIPLSKGQRFVVLHAGCENGFLPGCDLVFKVQMVGITTRK